MFADLLWMWFIVVEIFLNSFKHTDFKDVG